MILTNGCVRKNTGAFDMQGDTALLLGLLTDEGEFMRQWEGIEGQPRLACQNSCAASSLVPGR
jgi:hypothetical protein